MQMSQKMALPALAILGLFGGQAGAASGPTNFEGLVEVRVQTLDYAQVRPDVVFSVYTGVMLGNIQLAFRTPDRSEGEFPISDEQKALFHDALKSAFLSELVALRNIEFVSAPGRDVLRLSVRVQDITTAVAPRGVTNVGRGAMALQAVGEVTLVLELFDSRSGEILARAADTKASEGAAIAQDGGMGSKWDGVEKLCARWASTTRTRLESLLSGR